MRIDRLRTRLVGAVAFGIMAAPSASFAQDYLRDGWYAGARGVYALVDFDAAGKAENTFGFNTFLGYRAWKMFGADLEFEYIPGVHVSGKGSPSFEIRTFNFGFNFRTYPLGRLIEEGSWLERVQPYLSAGIANQWVKIDGNPGNEKHQGDAAGRLGGGLDVYLTESLALTADARYTLGAGEVDDDRYWSLGWGLLYRFGAGGDGGSLAEEEDEDEEHDAADEAPGDAE